MRKQLAVRWALWLSMSAVNMGQNLTLKEVQG